jgi:hypothetical protein
MLPKRARVGPVIGWAEDNEYYSRGIPEATLNEEARKLLLALSFVPSNPPADAETLTGLARSLDASAWIESGGSVLLAWRASTEMILDVQPVASRKTAFVLTRVFKGAAK